ncbi:hypothetical protein CF335_g8959, partial [Tilletia laevis]
QHHAEEFSDRTDLKGLAQHFGRAMRDPLRTGRALLLAPQWAFDPQSNASRALGVKVAKDKDAAARRAKLDSGLNDFINHCRCRRQVLVDSMRLDTTILASHLPNRALRMVDVLSSPPSIDNCLLVSRPHLDPSEDPSSRSNQMWDLVVLQCDSPSSRRGHADICCDLCSATSASHSDSPPHALRINSAVPSTQHQQSSTQQQPSTASTEASVVKHAYVPRIPPDDFGVVRREFAASLRLWRRTTFTKRPRASYLNASTLLSEQAIINLVAQAVRMLAQRVQASILRPAYTRSLLQAEHVLFDDDDIEALMDHLRLWLDEAEVKYRHLVLEHHLTPMGEVPRTRASQLASTSTSSTAQ